MTDSIPPWDLNSLDQGVFHTAPFADVWEVLPSCLVPCTRAKPALLGLFQSVAGCPLSVCSSSLLSRHRQQRRRSLGKAYNQASQKCRVWKCHLLPQDYHQLQAVRMVPGVRFFMERKLSGFCILRMQLKLFISLQICLISPFGPLIYVIKHWF